MVQPNHHLDPRSDAGRVRRVSQIHIAAGTVLKGQRGKATEAAQDVH